MTNSELFLCKYQFAYVCIQVHMHVCAHIHTQLAEMSDEEWRMEKLCKWSIYYKISFKNKTEQIKKICLTIKIEK